jgi:hypothetical protein
MRSTVAHLGGNRKKDEREDGMRVMLEVVIDAKIPV